MRTIFSYNLASTMERSSYTFPWVKPKCKIEGGEWKKVKRTLLYTKKLFLQKKDRLSTKRGALLFIKSLEYAFLKPKVQLNQILKLCILFVFA